ncbi:hypothetical protein FFF34_003155 [Inquilinus sp. KBS0705]|nr:hypothetical protein FFF34_003155 [Inquilinus sp. KBS0705]
MKPKRKSTWLKNRGYLHLTNQIDVNTQRGEILGKVRDKDFVIKHAFLPLIHTNIKVRRYKVVDDAGTRAHSYKGKTSAKLRPLHYATHIDSMIFGYYGEILQNAYLKELDKIDHLSKCVTAYRRIEDPAKKNTYKSTIHFAHEVFEEIKKRAETKCWVLKFDIEKFFSSMNHTLLKQAWANLIGELTLPEDHYKVFKAATKFSYILKDDLRLKSNSKGRRLGFDERQLADNRKHNVNSFFKNPVKFREAVNNGRFRIYKNEFRNKQNKMMGIPQGLPISATLANLYLLEFDKAVLDKVVVNLSGYYRRYSDDIIVICDEENKDDIIDFIGTTLELSKVELSKEKTEQHCFFPILQTDGSSKPVSHLLKGKELLINRPLTYLGFEFYGYRTLIKSANLSKFYRRMIVAVKSRSSRARLAVDKYPSASSALFKRRLYRLYTNINLDKKRVDKRYKRLVPNKFGYYILKTERVEDKFNSNYFTYGKRASLIMNEPAIERQVRRHRAVFNEAIYLHHELKKM